MVNELPEERFVSLKIVKMVTLYRRFPLFLYLTSVPLDRCQQMKVIYYLTGNFFVFIHSN